MEKKNTRSFSYQAIFHELSCSNEMLQSFSNEESLHKRLNPFAYNEEVLELEDQLKIEFWRIVNTLLTSRQKEVIRLYADGYTQMEIAKMLDVNQSSITKSINGNVDYKNGKKSYGGIRRKVKKIVETDPKVKEILAKIQELRDEDY